MSDLEKLRPPSGVVQIGIREYEDLVIWPLSISDQLDLEKVLDTAITNILSSSISDLTFVLSVKKVIEENIVSVLQLITDHDSEAKVRKLLKKITNNQLVEICQKIYEMNYEAISKNVLRLLGAMMPSATRRQSQPSSSDTQDTDLSTSPDSASSPEG